MELVGGIKTEYEWFKNEPVEITANDIADLRRLGASNEICLKNRTGPRAKKEVRHRGALPKVRPGNATTRERLVLNSVDVKVDPKYIERRDDFRYHCLRCNKFSGVGYDSIERHIRLRHMKKTRGINQCPHCPYQSPWDLGPHILHNHTDPSEINWFHCEHCKSRFKSKPGLLKHIRAIHMRALKWHQCDTCQKLFKAGDALRRHVNFVHLKNTDKYKCENCDYKTHSKYMLNYHSTEKHANPDELETLECGKCDYKTKFRRRLHHHTRSCHKIRTFQCHLCGSQTKSKEILKLHMIYHKEDKESDLKFKCPECPYRTYRGYSYQVHLLTHKKPEELTMFRCYHCPFESKRKDNLKAHIFKHDIFKTAHSCPHCDYQTRSEELLAKHLRGHEK